MKIIIINEENTIIVVLKSYKKRKTDTPIKIKETKNNSIIGNIKFSV